MKKSLKITLIFLSIILIIILLLSLIISPITTSYINKNGKQLIGRKIQVEKIKINTLTGHVALHNFHIFEDNDSLEWITLDTLDINTKLFRLFTRQIYLQHITISGLNLNIIQNDTVFNFTSLLKHFSTSNTSQPKNNKKWKLAFYNIQLNHSQIHYSDIKRSCNWNLNDINFETPGFSIGKQVSTNAGLSIKLADGGKLLTTANYNINNNNFHINVNVSNFPLNNAKSYLNDFIEIGKTKGILQANLTATGNISQFLDMTIGGHVNINDVNLKLKNRQTLLSLNQLKIDINKINFTHNIYDINTINIDGLNSTFEVFSNGNTITQLFKQDTTDIPSSHNNDTLQTNPINLKLKINDFNLNNSKITYIDNSLSKKFKYQLSNIQIIANNINLHNINNAQIKLTLPHHGQANIKWNGVINNWKSLQNLELNITGLELSDLSPYSTTYFRYPFSKGKLSINSKNTIKDSKINAIHQIHIDNAEVGKKQPDIETAFNIPLKTILYILSNKDNQIDIELPVNGDLNNPDFKYFKTIWHALGNLFIKITTEPFRMVNNAFGITNKDRYIAINPTDSIFTKSQYKLLEKYAKTLKKEPTLKIYFKQQIDHNSEEFILDLANKRDQLLYEHLTKNLKVDTSQFTITSTDIENLNQPGYHIYGQLIDSLAIE